MKTKKMLLIFSVIVLTALGCFYVYLIALSSMWTINKPDKRPFFVTTKPITVKNILLPEGTKIIYDKQYFWEKYKQEELLKEKNITEISFKEGTTINWGGVPITSIVRFYNSEMHGFSVYADFSILNNQTRFSNLWQNCNDALGITVENSSDWSFNKENILDVESCGVNYQRYFKENENQQKYLDHLYNELILIKE